MKKGAKWRRRGEGKEKVTPIPNSYSSEQVQGEKGGGIGKAKVFGHKLD
jgi:hypothetical protein